MHILFHTQYFPPEIGAPQARISELAQRLYKKNVKVTVLTAMPNYPTGKIYPGYGGLLQREDFGYATIIRTWILPGTGYAFTRRLANYFSFALSSLIFGILKVNSPDVVITESPPLFLGITGFFLSRYLKAKWVFNVSDLWPKSAEHMGLIEDGYLLRFVFKLEEWLYRKADLVTGQSDEIIKDVSQRFPDLRVEKITNGVDPERFNSVSKNSLENTRNRFGVNGQFGVVYTGLHGLAQGLDQIIESAKQMSSMNTRFVFVGDGPAKEQLVTQANAHSLSNVQFSDPVGREEIPSILQSMDAILVSLKRPIPGAVPSKLYEAMAAGKPVVYIGGGGGAEIVNKYGVGLTVPPDDSEALATAIKRLIENPKLRDQLGRNGRFAAAKYFNRNNIAERFYQLLYDLVYEDDSS